MRSIHIISAGIVVLVALGLGYLFLTSPTPEKGKDLSNLIKVPYTEIVDPTGFVNTEEITIGELVGKKVILVDFLTYSCINCQRTFPYLNLWYEKYKDQGLEIVGIHTPEFAFEKNIDNVRKAMEGFGVTHPIVLDNNYSTWRAYGNRYWPRKYLIDINGNVVYDHIGEGAYEETEKKIVELLAQRAEKLGLSKIDMGDGLAASSLPKGENGSRSPETYFGALRNTSLGNGTTGQVGSNVFTVPKDLSVDTLYLGGNWNVEEEYIESLGNSTVFYKYTAKEVYVVAESLNGGSISVYQDGKLVDSNKGADVLTKGVVDVGDSKLYKLINNHKSEKHVLELRIKGAVRLYAFTFG